MLKDSVDANYRASVCFSFCAWNAPTTSIAVFRISRQRWMDKPVQSAGYAIRAKRRKNGDPQTQARAFDYNPRLTKSYGE